MSANLLSLPGELRNAIFQQLLMDQEPINPRNRPCLPQALTPELLRVNKAIHHEASSLLYSQNCFDLTTCDSERLISFLNQIGRNNASRIQDIYIEFPDICVLAADMVTFGEDCIRVLAKIRSDCTNLSTITTSLGSTNAMALELDALDKPHIVAEALALVDTHFRAITSLQQIIVKVYEDGPSAALRRVMESHGWTSNVTEQADEFRFICGNEDDDDDDDDYYNDTLRDAHYDEYESYEEHESYDDTDSDITRKAGN